jgi:hypothetical protein
MTTMIRTWLGFAALGAGLVHLAVAAGAPLVATLLLALIGAFEAAWGVTALAREHVPVPRAALAGAVLAVAGWVVVLFVGAGAMSHMAGTSGAAVVLPALPMLGAAVLDLACAASLAVLVRRGRPAVVRQPGVWPYLGGVVAGAAVVGGITSVCLGATPVGAIAMQGMNMGR